MDTVAQMLAPLLALAIVISYMVEVIFDGLEAVIDTEMPWEKKEGDSEEALNRKTRYKRFATILVSVLIGVIIAWPILRFNYLQAVGFDNLSPTIGQIVTGILAAAIAPYTHQILQLLFQIQKLAERIQKGSPDVTVKPEAEQRSPASGSTQAQS